MTEILRYLIRNIDIFVQSLMNLKYYCNGTVAWASGVMLNACTEIDYIYCLQLESCNYHQYLKMHQGLTYMYMELKRHLWYNLNSLPLLSKVCSFHVQTNNIFMP